MRRASARQTKRWASSRREDQPCQSAKRSTRLTEKRTSPKFGLEELPQGRHRRLGPTAWRNSDRGWTRTVGKVAAGGEADAGHRVVEAEAVLAPAVGGDAEEVLAELARGRPLRLGGPRPAVLEAGQEPLGQLGPGREVEGVDAGGQLPEPRLRSCIFATRWSDGAWELGHDGWLS